VVVKVVVVQRVPPNPLFAPIRRYPTTNWKNDAAL